MAKRGKADPKAYLNLTTHSRQRVARGVVEEWSNLLTFNALWPFVAIRSGSRYAKWAGGSRSQTHRRAAKGGFTQDDGNVIYAALCVDYTSCSVLIAPPIVF